MPEFLDRLNPQQLFWVVFTVSAAVVLVVFILSVAHYQLRALADETALARERHQAEVALKQDLLRRDLPASELKLTLDTLGVSAAAGGGVVAGEPDETLRARVVKNLVTSAEGVEPETVERTVALVAAADRSTLLTLSKLLGELVDEGVSGEAVFASVSALCRNRPPVPPPAAPKPAAAPAESGVDLQFAQAFEAK